MPQFFDVSHKTQPTHTRLRSFGRAGILLHSTEGINSLAWLQGNDPTQVDVASADFLINRLGDIYQLTSRQHHAYHVGVAEWHGLRNDRSLLNELLVGIEMESHETNQPRYTDLQLISCAALCRRLMAQHLFGVLNIEYHRFVARPIGRRSDPVNFPLYVWSKELLQPSQLDPALVFPAVLP
jgi:N-acetylmuramoyl-L-alanine amidase